MKIKDRTTNLQTYENHKRKMSYSQEKRSF